MFSDNNRSNAVLPSFFSIILAFFLAGACYLLGQYKKVAFIGTVTNAIIKRILCDTNHFLRHIWGLDKEKLTSNNKSSWPQ